MEFPWRCNVDTIAMDLKVSWEMSDKICIPAFPSYTMISDGLNADSSMFVTAQVGLGLSSVAETSDQGFGIFH